MNIKNLLKGTLCLLMAGAVCDALVAQEVVVSPIPQEIKWGGDKAFCNNASFKVQGLKDADADAVALLKKNLNISGKGVKLYVGERGDKAVKKFKALIPEKPEGYYLSVTP